MEVLRLLIFAQVRYHSTSPMLLHNLRRDLLYDPYQFKQKVIIRIAEGEQGTDMALGNHYYMHRVERARMVERKYMSRLNDFVNGRAPV